MYLCLQEVKNAQAAAAEGHALMKNGTDEDVSSTSPGIYPVSMVAPVGHGDEQDLARGLGDPRGGHSPGCGRLNGQRKAHVKEEPSPHDVTESSVFVPNGPALYLSLIHI